MIIVTGATGALNGATVEHLLKIVPADQIGVSVRDVAKAQHLADRGVRVRRGSYDVPAALRDAFEGAEQVLLVSSNDPGADPCTRRPSRPPSRPGRPHPLHQSPGRGARQPVPPRAATRRDRSAAGRTPASPGLRHSPVHAHSLDWMLGPWRETSIIAAPADAPHVLDRPRRRSGGSRGDLAAPRPFDRPMAMPHRGRGRDVRGHRGYRPAQPTGRDIRRVVMDDDAWVADRVAHGAPDMMARFMLEHLPGRPRGTLRGHRPAARLLPRPPAAHGARPVRRSGRRPEGTG